MSELLDHTSHKPKTAITLQVSSSLCDLRVLLFKILGAARSTRLPIKAIEQKITKIAKGRRKVNKRPFFGVAHKLPNMISPQPSQYTPLVANRVKIPSFGPSARAGPAG